MNRTKSLVLRFESFARRVLSGRGMFRVRFPPHCERSVRLDSHVWFVLTRTLTEIQATHSVFKNDDSTLLSEESLLLVSRGI